MGVTWGGDQASGFWSLETLVAATLTAAASGYSNWSHDVGAYPGERLVARCPRELLLRWVQFGCFTPLMHAHGRFEQEAWTYDAETLDLYRDYVLLHERLLPYVRAAAATAARTGLPIIRPLLLSEAGDERGWSLADQYGYGPALWVAPVLEHGAREREVSLPRASGATSGPASACPEGARCWRPRRSSGSPSMSAAARSSSCIRPSTCEPAWATRRNRSARWRRRSEATPPLGHTAARLADGTRIGWRRGEWSIPPGRVVSVARR